MPIAADPHARAIIAALQSAGLTVGDGEGRTDSAQRIIAPQVVVYMVPGGMVDGELGDPDGWADARFQLTAIGRVASEARVTGDKAEAALAGGITVAGRSIPRVRPIDPWGRPERDHDVTPPLFYTTRVYGLHTFPT